MTHTEILTGSKPYLISCPSGPYRDESDDLDLLKKPSGNHCVPRARLRTANSTPSKRAITKRKATLHTIKIVLLGRTTPGAFVGMTVAGPSAETKIC